MINKTFIKASQQLLKSTQSVYYTLNSPTIGDLSLIYKQSPFSHFEAALIGFKKESESANGDSILHDFHSYFDAKAIETILQITKISPNVKNKNGETALLHICKNSSREDNGNLCLDKNLGKNDEYFSKFVSINDSIKITSAEIGRQYIKNGADVNLSDIFGLNPIYYAIIKGNINLALQIAKHPDFNPSIRYRQEDNQDAFDLSLRNPKHMDLSLAIFIAMKPEYRKLKIFDLENNLYIQESLLLACKSLSDVSETSIEIESQEDEHISSDMKKS